MYVANTRSSQYIHRISSMPPARSLHPALFAVMLRLHLDRHYPNRHHPNRHHPNRHHGAAPDRRLGQQLPPPFE